MRVKMDVKEDANSYTVLAEIPGVKKEDIQVSIDGKSGGDQRRSQAPEGREAG